MSPHRRHRILDRLLSNQADNLHTWIQAPLRVSPRISQKGNTALASTCSLRNSKTNKKDQSGRKKCNHYSSPTFEV